MAKEELGTKRTCPETGKKFYDLNADPIKSPYTGKTYPLSFFETSILKASPVAAKDEEEDDTGTEAEDTDAEVISLEEADEETKGGSDDIPDIDGDDDDVDLGDDDDTFLEEDEDDDNLDDLDLGVDGDERDDES